MDYRSGVGNAKFKVFTSWKLDCELKAMGVVNELLDEMKIDDLVENNNLST